MMTMSDKWIFDAVEKHKKKKTLPKGGLEIVTAIGNKLIEKRKFLKKRKKD